MMIELEYTDTKVNLVSPVFTTTALNNFAGTESVDDGLREVMRAPLHLPGQWRGAALSLSNHFKRAAA
jgi:hypothetical protein